MGIGGGAFRATAVGAGARDLLPVDWWEDRLVAADDMVTESSSRAVDASSSLSDSDSDWNEDVEDACV